VSAKIKKIYPVKNKVKMNIIIIYNVNKYKLMKRRGGNYYMLIQNKKEQETRMVGGQVPVDLYWTFKAVAATRKETSVEALLHALRLYVDPIEKEGEEI
jgi:hypothetical protein